MYLPRITESRRCVGEREKKDKRMNGRREKERMRESKANRKTEERLIERGASRKREEPV